MPRFHHHRLPEYSTLLAGRQPPSEAGFGSELLQIWYNNTYNNTEQTWADSAPHAHLSSDGCFIVLRGSLLVEVEGERILIGSREFCCFPRGLYHAVVQVFPPVESLTIRAPSIDDKTYSMPPVDPCERWGASPPMILHRIWTDSYVREADRACLALAALKGQKTSTNWKVEFGVHPVQITQWKRQLLDASPSIFEFGFSRGSSLG